MVGVFILTDYCILNSDFWLFELLFHFTDSHFISFVFREGWVTIMCHTTL